MSGPGGPRSLKSSTPHVPDSSEQPAQFVLGGLEGADKQCQTLAQAAGAGGKTWHAYLSTQGSGAVNARDRIGSGPWKNAKGTVIAKDVADLHSGNNNVTKQTALKVT